MAVLRKVLLTSVIKNKYKHIDVDAYYLCGPEAMIHTVKDVLTEHGKDENRIHFELFKSSKPDTIVDATTASGRT